MSFGETFNIGGIVASVSNPTVTNVTSASGNEGTSLVHTVTLSAATTTSTNYTYSLSGGTATAGVDYTVPPTFSNGVTLSGSLTVPTAVSSFTVTVAAISDGSSESSETYNLTIGGITGVGTISDSSSAITPSIVASRTTGTAPLAVFFDASGTTAASLTSLPFHELLYSWDFGDGTGTFWSYGTKAGIADKNYAYGPEASHVFESAGSKTVTLTVIHISSGGTITTASTTQSITVTAESTTYPDSSCYYIDSVAAVTPGSGGVPAASTGIQTSSMTTAIAARTTATRQFYFKRGGTYSIDASLAIQKQNIRINAYGAGADPVFTFSSASDGFVVYDSTNSGSGFQIRNVKFDGGSTSAGPGNWKLPIATQASLGGTVTDILVHNCEAMVNGSIGSVSSVDGFYVVGCNLHDLSGGNGNVGVYSQYGSRLVVLGCNITNCSGIEHNIRSQGCDRVVISNNTLSVPQNGKQMTTIRGYSDQASLGDPGLGSWSGNWAEKIVISDNSYDGGASYVGLCVEFAPQNTGAYERIRDIICERNLFIGSIATAIGSEAESGVTIRNNLFQCDYSGEQVCVDIYSRNGAGVLAGSSTYVYNNSCYMPGAHAFSFARITETGVLDYPTGTVLTNNLVYAPNATANGQGSGSTASLLATGASGSYYTLTTNSSDSQIDATTPGFTIPPTTTLTTWKPTTGYGINGGTYVAGAYEDFFLAQRTGTPDMGAVNP